MLIGARIRVVIIFLSTLSLVYKNVITFYQLM